MLPALVWISTFLGGMRTVLNMAPIGWRRSSPQQNSLHQTNATSFIQDSYVHLKLCLHLINQNWRLYIVPGLSIGAQSQAVFSTKIRRPSEMFRSPLIPNSCSDWTQEKANGIFILVFNPLLSSDKILSTTAGPGLTESGLGRVGSYAFRHRFMY